MLLIILNILVSAEAVVDITFKTSVNDCDGYTKPCKLRSSDFIMRNLFIITIATLLQNDYVLAY